MNHLRRDIPLMFMDTGVVFPAYLVPMVLRFNGSVPGPYWRNFVMFLPVAMVMHLLGNYLFGLYGSMWRYASVEEARRVLLAGFSGGIFVLTAGLIVPGRHRPLPISVLVLGSILSLIGFGAIRFQSRLFAFRRRSEIQKDKRVLIVGAGHGGSLVLKDMVRNPSFGLHPVALVDDNPSKLGQSLHGVRVLGTRADIPRLVADLSIDQVLIAIPSATSETVRDVAALCEEADVTLRVLPTVHETLGGRITARDIRDLQIEDLLGRQQAQMDRDAIAAMLVDRRVLVTGAGGSIGSEIVRQVLEFEPAKIVLLDHDETHLHDLMVDLGPRTDVESVLADVRDQNRMFAVFAHHSPHVVFHAAAHKHVPLLEIYPDEALSTNVFGTANVADAAVAAGVHRFVLISTDKAINPSSVMGASKWFAEQIVRSLQRSGSQFCAVRFGNVLGSRGSVIPTFFRQIQRGGPVTVTDPSMSRYFMSVHEAVLLVLQAAAMAQGGEVFTLDMGEPMLIIDLARKLIRLSGRVPGRDVPISFIGPRPGEKVTEEIVAPGETPTPTAHPSIVVATPSVPDQPSLRRAIRELEALAGEDLRDELSSRMLAYTRPAQELVVTGNR